MTQKESSEILFTKNDKGELELLTILLQSEKADHTNTTDKEGFLKWFRKFFFSKRKESFKPNNLEKDIRSRKLISILGSDTQYQAKDNAKYKEEDEDENVRFRIQPKDTDEIRYQVAPMQPFQSVNTFRKNVIQLIELGFTDEQILEIIKGCRKKRHILIDRHLKVFLVDDTMVEVEMNPLSKTLFLFYLKHPEGVALKCLSDYKTELSGIYSKLTGRESVEDIEKSIRDLVDPTSNSVHEKCSRIKAAFKDKVSTSTVSDYVPSGAPGEPRFISLDRNLVTWEGSL